MKLSAVWVALVFALSLGCQPEKGPKTPDLYALLQPISASAGYTYAFSPPSSQGHPGSVLIFSDHSNDVLVCSGSQIKGLTRPTPTKSSVGIERNIVASIVAGVNKIIGVDGGITVDTMIAFDAERNDLETVGDYASILKTPENEKCYASIKAKKISATQGYFSYITRSLLVKKFTFSYKVKPGVKLDNKDGLSQYLTKIGLELKDNNTITLGEENVFMFFDMNTNELTFEALGILRSTVGQLDHERRPRRLFKALGLTCSYQVVQRGVLID